VTCPYTVREPAGWGSLLDAIFVNVEFLPGVLMLRRREPVAFALGAAALFRSEEFRRRADWEKLGSTLADDNELGRQLGPARISRWTVETLPMPRDPAGALSHYLRWHKTVRWCEPIGYAAQALVMPMIGWLGAAVFFGQAAAPGAAGTLLFESTMALAICVKAGFRMPASWIPLFLLWPIARILTWFSSWLPTPVTWGEQKSRWWGLRRLELFGRAKSP
jgi:ceramide glucosyltransferase